MIKKLCSTFKGSLSGKQTLNPLPQNLHENILTC